MTQGVLDVDSKLFRSVMGKFATGVNVIGYFRDREPAALTANAFMSVSLRPPLILISLRNASTFLVHTKVGSRFGVSILAHDQHPISEHFGGRPGKGGPAPLNLDTGVPLVEGAIATMVARVVEFHPAGDHCLVISGVEAVRETDRSPLVFFRGRYASVDDRFHAPKPTFSAASELSWWTD